MHNRTNGWSKDKQENHAIAKMTARCAQYVSALKTVGLYKRKISRRLRKNLWCGEIIFEVFYPMWSRHLWPKRYTWTDRRTLWHHHAVKIRRQIIADIIGITDILSQRYRYMAHHYSPAILQAFWKLPDVTHFPSPFYVHFVHACRSGKRAINNIYRSLGVPQRESVYVTSTLNTFLRCMGTGI